MIMMSEGFVNTIAENVTEALFEEYDKMPSALRGICKQDETEKDGKTGITIIGLDELYDTPDVEEAKLTEYEEGFKWYCRVKNFRRAYKIEENMLNDMSEGELLSRLRDTGNAWGEKVREAEEKEVAKIFVKGSLSAGDLEAFDGTHTGHTDPYPKLIYDGKTFFAADHPLFKSNAVTFSNLSDSGSGKTPTFANIKAAYELMTVTNAYDERNEPTTLIPPDTVLLNPVNELDVEQVLTSEAQTDKNIGNTNVLRGKFNIVMSPYLTSNSGAGWYMGTAGKGVRFIDRSPAKVTVEKVPGKNVWLVEVKRRFGVCVDQWRYWSAWNVATS